MDHLVPLARGGKSIKANLVPACKECNTKKKAKFLFDMDEPFADMSEYLD